jgi:hypothetical protein
LTKKGTRGIFTVHAEGRNIFLHRDGDSTAGIVYVQEGDGMRMT